MDHGPLWRSQGRDLGVQGGRDTRPPRLCGWPQRLRGFRRLGSGLGGMRFRDRGHPVQVVDLRPQGDIVDPRSAKLLGRGGCDEIGHGGVLGRQRCWERFREGGIALRAAVHLSRRFRKRLPPREELPARVPGAHDPLGDAVVEPVEGALALCPLADHEFPERGAGGIALMHHLLSSGFPAPLREGLCGGKSPPLPHRSGYSSCGTGIRSRPLSLPGTSSVRSLVFSGFPSHHLHRCWGVRFKCASPISERMKKKIGGSAHRADHAGVRGHVERDVRVTDAYVAVAVH